jgi:hypothetical protein
VTSPLDLIDTDTVGSDGWWFRRLTTQLQAQARHCEVLQKRYEGQAPLPWVDQTMSKSVEWFIEKARTPLERLIVGAVLSRLKIVGIKTPADADADGDQQMWTQWLNVGMPLVIADMLKMRLVMGRAYIIVNRREDGSALVTAEDPRTVTAVTDPTDPTRVVAALKLIYNDVTQEDVAYLYFEGRVRVARRPRATRPVGEVVVPRFSRAFRWDDDVRDPNGVLIREGASGPIPKLADFGPSEEVLGGLNPVVPFVNEDGQAEFEPHVDLLNRISLLWLQLLTIIAFQAFRQRAAKGLPTKDPETGETIDYSEIFEWAPNALWNVPASVEFWESAPADPQGVLLALRDSMKDLAATSFTPLYSITPDAANGSAEGASLQREGQVFKVEGHHDRVTPGVVQVNNRIVRVTGVGAQGGRPIWAPAERFSLAERGSAASQVKGILPNEAIWQLILQLPPEQYEQFKTQFGFDLLLQRQFAAANGAQNANAAAPPR